MSKRQSIVSVLDAILRDITITNGYMTDAGRNVFPWRDSDIQPSELPAIIYYDRLSHLRTEVLNIFRWVLAIDIMCYSNSPSGVRAVIADVIKAIGVGDISKWGGNAITTELTDASEMSVERRGRTASEAIITINIVYDVPMWET